MRVAESFFATSKRERLSQDDNNARMVALVPRVAKNATN
jgi:hypothetical protein